MLTLNVGIGKLCKINNNIVFIVKFFLINDTSKYNLI